MFNNNTSHGSLPVKFLKGEKQHNMDLWVLSFFNIYVFIWLRLVKIIACSIVDLSRSMWDLVPWPGIEPGSPALGVWSLSHWTTREVPWRISDSSLCNKESGILARLFPFRKQMGTALRFIVCYTMQSICSAWEHSLQLYHAIFISSLVGRDNSQGEL